MGFFPPTLPCVAPVHPQALLMGLQLSMANGQGGALDKGVLDAWMAEFAVDTKTITKAEFATVLSRWGWAYRGCKCFFVSIYLLVHPVCVPATVLFLHALVHLALPRLSCLCHPRHLTVSSLRNPLVLYIQYACVHQNRLLIQPCANRIHQVGQGAGLAPRSSQLRCNGQGLITACW